MKPPLLINLKAIDELTYPEKTKRSCFAADYYIWKSGKFVKIKSKTTRGEYVNYDEMNGARRELGIKSSSLLK